MSILRHLGRALVLALALLAGLPARALDGVPCLLGGIVAFEDCCCRPVDAPQPSCCTGETQSPSPSPSVRQEPKSCDCSIDAPTGTVPARPAEAQANDRLSSWLEAGSIASTATPLPHLDALPAGATGPPTGPHLVPPLRGGRTLLTVNCVARC